MKTPHQQRIEEFMRKAGQELPPEPVIPSEKVRELRAKLILEEALETIEALGFLAEVLVSDNQKMSKPIVVAHDRGCNLIEVADGCADISVVTIGTLSALGISDQPLLEEVDRSNLDKFKIPICDACHQPMTHEGKGLYTCTHASQVFNKRGPYRDDDGKWVKAPDFQPPRIQTVLAAQHRSRKCRICNEPVSPGSTVCYDHLKRGEDGQPREPTAIETCEMIAKELKGPKVENGVLKESAPVLTAEDNGVRYDPPPVESDFPADFVPLESPLGLILPYPKSPTGFARIVAYEPEGHKRVDIHSKHWKYRLVSYDPVNHAVRGDLDSDYFHGPELDELVKKTQEKASNAKA